MKPAPTNPKRPALRPDTLLSSVAILLVVNVVQRSVGFGRGVLFCRWLEPEALGLWEMAFGFLLLATPLAVLGLPGSFGRYLTRYRERGQLLTFLLRTTTWTFGLAAVAVGLLAWQAPLFAQIVFGSADQAPLMRIVAFCLAAMVAHHFLEAVFAGLRLFRVVSAMHFGHSMAFATIALLLTANWRADASSIVLGYGLACTLSTLGVLAWSITRVDLTPDTGTPPPHSEFWYTLMRFAFWLWVSNLLANVFSTIDRYMILHYSGFDNALALEMVGNYHASIIVPVLLTSVANLLLGAMTPHLSHEWEAGHRQVVSDRINLALKLSAVGMLGIGCGVLMFCPVLFHLAFESKYNTGLDVLPWTLVACVWYSLLLIAQTYILCAEKTRSAIGPLAVGIAANVALNLVLLPLWGLPGAVMATAVATVLAFGAQLLVNRRAGMRITLPTVLLGLAPLTLAAGLAPALATLVVVVWIALSRDGLLTSYERNEILGRLQAVLAAIAAKFRRGQAVASPSP